MWKQLAMFPRVFYALLWSVPVWFFLHIQDQSWFPAAIIDLLVLVCLSFLIQYGVLHTWMKRQDTVADRRLRLDRTATHALLALIAILGFLLLLITATSSTEELGLKAALAYVYLFLVSLHTACACTRYSFRRYGQA